MLHQKEPGSTLPMEFKFNSAEQPIRFEIIQDVPWAIAKDICIALGLNNNREALTKLDDDEKLVSEFLTSGQRRKMLLVNESGIYSLIFRSNKPEAKMFRKWVTNDVLPQIRRNGTYQPKAAPTFKMEDGPEQQHEQLCKLIYQACDVAGNQRMLASYLGVSESVLTDLRNRPFKISQKLMRRVEYGCRKVVGMGQVPAADLFDINTKEIMRMWFDIVKIENYELRKRLSHRIAAILGREEYFTEAMGDCLATEEKGAGHE